MTSANSGVKIYNHTNVDTYQSTPTVIDAGVLVNVAVSNCTKNLRLETRLS